jgi:signal transduction histidine kinase
MKDMAMSGLMAATSRPTRPTPAPAGAGTGATGTPATPTPPARDDGERRAGRRRQEFTVRITVAVLILVFNELFPIGQQTQSIIRLSALIGLVMNGPYWVGIQTGRWLREQAYLRMLIDVTLTTAGLYGAGGLGAAQFIGVYAVVPVYTAIVFSSQACALATVFATVAYLTVAILQTAGALPMIRPPIPNAWEVAAFNLLMLNIVGWLAAVLAQAYRASRQRLAAAYAELERAHDEWLKLNAQIEQAGRRYVLSEVVAGVTHELRNALQGAFGHLWLARRNARGLSPDAAEHLAQVEYACESAMRIIRTTLDNARRPASDREAVAVADVVKRVTELKGFDLRRDGITLRVDLPAALPAVLGNAFQLQQVLLNLVANAHDALRGGNGRREIALVGATEAGRVVLEVQDTGPGIPLAVLPHVFEPFYTTKESGTGLGLAISAGIIEALGGTLGAENRREGGAVFRLALPVAV